MQVTPDGKRTLILDKGGHQYVLRYVPGSEESVMDELARLAEDPDSRLDWLDAAAMSFQVTHDTAGDCIRALTPPEPD